MFEFVDGIFFRSFVRFFFGPIMFRNMNFEHELNEIVV